MQKISAKIAMTLAACLLMPVAYGAPNVLFLSPTEGYPGWQDSVKNAYVTAGATVTDRSAALSGPAISPTLFNGKDVVVIATSGANIETVANRSVIEAALANRPDDDLAFIFHYEGCCHSGTNMSHWTNALNTLTGWTLAESGSQNLPSASPNFKAPRNDASPYASYFSGATLANLDIGQSQQYRVMTGVPDANTIYHNTPTAFTGRADGAYTLFIPRSESSHGNGACVLFMGDTNSLDPAAPYATQRSAFASAALALATSAHCKRPQPTHAVPTLHGWGLGLLAACMGTLGWARQRRRA